jgi:hypothetical protein
MSTLIFGWFFFAVAAGMLASIRRNRDGVGWFFVAILFSPLVAFVLLLILQPNTKRKMTRREIIAALEVARAKEQAAAKAVDPRWANLRSTPSAVATIDRSA